MCANAYTYVCVSIHIYECLYMYLQVNSKILCIRVERKVNV